MSVETAGKTVVSPPRTIFEVFAEVKRAVGPVGKDSQNKQQNFKFRGIDAVVNAAAAALDEHGVITAPLLKSIEYTTVQVGQARTTMGHVKCQVTYRFYGPAGDHFDADVPGEAMDSGDKATAKAMSVAYRIALIQALNLPTGDPDPDSQTYERSERSAGNAFENAKPAGRRDDSQPAGPRRDQVAEALAKLALQLANDTSKTPADLHERVSKQAAGKGKLDTPVDNPFGDGRVPLRDVLREAGKRMEDTTPPQDGQPSPDSAGEPAQDDSDAQATWVGKFLEALAAATTPDELTPKRTAIGQAIRDRIITTDTGSAMSGELTKRRRELAEASA